MTVNFHKLFFNNFVLFHISLDSVKRFHIVLFNAELLNENFVRNAVNVCVLILDGLVLNLDDNVYYNAKNKCCNYKINTNLNGAVDDSAENGFNVYKEFILCNEGSNCRNNADGGKGDVSRKTVRRA